MNKLNKHKFIVSFILTLYFLSWIFFGSETVIKNNLNLILETDFKQGLKFVDYRNNDTDSTIYLVNENNFGFFNNLAGFKIKNQQVMYIIEDDFRKYLKPELLKGDPLVFHFKSVFYNPFFAKVKCSYWFYGTDMQETGSKFCTWLFFTWIETPFKLTEGALNLIAFITKWLLVIIIPLLWIKLIYSTYFKSKGKKVIT